VRQLHACMCVRVCVCVCVCVHVCVCVYIHIHTSGVRMRNSMSCVFGQDFMWKGCLYCTDILQHTATYCNTLQHTATQVPCSLDALQIYQKTHLQRRLDTEHTATHCNVTTHCKIWQHTLLHETAIRKDTCDDNWMLQHTTQHCNTL